MFVKNNSKLYQEIFGNLKQEMLEAAPVKTELFDLS